MAEVITSTITDNRGRTIIVRKLSALDRMRVFEMLGGTLSDNMQYVAYAMVAACVTDIDGVKEPFPNNKRQLEAMVATLGDEGIEAVATAYKDFSVGETADLANIKN